MHTANWDQSSNHIPKHIHCTYRTPPHTVAMTTVHTHIFLCIILQLTHNLKYIIDRILTKSHKCVHPNHPSKSYTLLINPKFLFLNPPTASPVQQQFHTHHLLSFNHRSSANRENGNLNYPTTGSTDSYRKENKWSIRTTIPKELDGDKEGAR